MPYSVLLICIVIYIGRPFLSRSRQAALGTGTKPRSGTICRKGGERSKPVARLVRTVAHGTPENRTLPYRRQFIHYHHLDCSRPRIGTARASRGARRGHRLPAHFTNTELGASKGTALASMYPEGTLDYPNAEAESDPISLDTELA